MFAAFPLLALPVLAYNLLVLSLGGLGSAAAASQLGGRVLSAPMPSGAAWDISIADLLLASALVILFIEMLKSASSRGAAIVNHSLSMLVFIACLLELLLLRAFATSTFFLITLMVLLDVLAGFIVTIIAARRDVDVARPSRG